MFVSLQVLAPALNDNLLFHTFFIYTNQDTEWAHNVIEKLESPRLGFKCCCPDRDLGTGLTQPQVTRVRVSLALTSWQSHSSPTEKEAFALQGCSSSWKLNAPESANFSCVIRAFRGISDPPQINQRQYPEVTDFPISRRNFILGHCRYFCPGLCFQDKCVFVD